MEENIQPIAIDPSWEPLLREEFGKEYFRRLRASVRNSYLSAKVFPHPKRVFRAFDLCKPEEVRVVILGQDPYHTPGVADGLAFSSFKENPVPPSLANIFKEIESEYGVQCVKTPDLTHWARQGVLLLNATLTVESGKANSHVDFGWHTFTDAVINVVGRGCEHVVFMLWGNYAREKRTLIDGSKHFILESPHPSPLSAHKGFFGNNHFKNANAYLEEHGRGTITWC